MSDNPSPKEDIIRQKGIMGARIEIAGPEKGMYLVIGENLSPESLIVRNGGEVVMKLSPITFLATLPFHGYTSIKNSPLIRKIGPVTVDIQRFNKAIERLTNQVTNA